MRLIILALFSCFFCTKSQAQIQGTLLDTLDMKKVSFGSVSLLNQKDSTLLKSVRSNQQGQFFIAYKQPGDYLLLVAHPAYFIFSQRVSIDSQQSFIPLGNILLFQKSKMLSEVIVRGQDAIVLKGDTIQYYADSFKTKVGDVVEDLLRLLPGMEVDLNGAIVSQGKPVEKVLVNGEEFFGNDPTVATKNLQSKIVEKIEVYDTKDDQQSFLANDDESETKTINLKLKEGMQQGYFGKAATAGGIPDRWDNRCMINRFTDQEQISAFGTMSSTGNYGLNWDEQSKFGGNSLGGDGGANFVSSSDLDDRNPSFGIGGSASYGILKGHQLGARYANKFRDGKEELNVNYGFGHTVRQRNSRSYTENLLPDATFFKGDTTQSIERTGTHSLSAKYKTELTKRTELIYDFRANLKNTDNKSYRSSVNTNDSEVPISTNERTYTSASTTSQLGNRIILNKEFRKKERKLSASLYHAFFWDRGNGFLESENAMDLQGNGVWNLVDQKKEIRNKQQSFNASCSWSEPLSKHWKLRLKYDYRNNHTNASNISLDTLLFTAGNYLHPIDSLSSIFYVDNNLHQTGIEIGFEKNKFRLSAGTDVGFNQFVQSDLLRNLSFNYNRTNLFPKLNMRYNFSKYRKINFYYSGRTLTPSANQLQPTQNNINPLDITMGNPNLKLGYFQSTSFNYRANAPLSGNYSYIGISFNNSIRRVGTSRVFDQNGRTVTTFINLPTSYSTSFHFNQTIRLHHSDWKLNLSTSSTYAYSPNSVNGIIGYSTSLNTRLNPGITFYDKNLLSFRFNPNVNFTQTTNSILSNRNIQYISFDPSVHISLFFPHFFTMNTNFNYDYQPAVAPYTTPFSRGVWNASLNKQILKSKTLHLSISIFDMLNQNKGYYRTSTDNYNTESFYNTLARYWMLSASWNFFSGPAAKDMISQNEEEGSGINWRRR